MEALLSDTHTHPCSRAADMSLLVVLSPAQDPCIIVSLDHNEPQARQRGVGHLLAGCQEQEVVRAGTQR